MWSITAVQAVALSLAFTKYLGTTDLCQLYDSYVSLLTKTSRNPNNPPSQYGSV